MGFITTFPIWWIGICYVADISMFTTNFTINYSKNSDFGYKLLVNTDCPEYLQQLHKYLPFSPEEIATNKEKN